MIQLDSSHPVETGAPGNFRLHDPWAFSLTIGVVSKDFKQVFLELANQLGTALMKIHLFTSSPLLAASLGTDGLAMKEIEYRNGGVVQRGAGEEEKNEPHAAGVGLVEERTRSFSS